MNIDYLLKEITRFNDEKYEEYEDIVDTFINSEIKDNNKKDIYLYQLSRINLDYKISSPFEENYFIMKLHGLLIKIKNYLNFIKSSSPVQEWKSINIQIHPDILSHIWTLLETDHFYNAVEESYKYVRNKLREITWEEQWHKAFKEGNFPLIFWKEAESNEKKTFLNELSIYIMLYKIFVMKRLMV